MNSISFLETMLEYYLPGLDVSKLSDDEFIQKSAFLNVIRKMEGKDSISSLLNKMFNHEQ